MQLIQYRDYTDYILNRKPIGALQANGADITLDLIPAFHRAHKLEWMRRYVEKAVGKTVTFSMDESYTYLPGEDRKAGRFTWEGGELETGIAFKMMSASDGWDQTTGRQWSRYAKQLGVGADGAFLVEEGQITGWVPADNKTGVPSCLTLPYPQTAEQFEANMRIIGGLLKNGAWV